jgi:hypothetical protein
MAHDLTAGVAAGDTLYFIVSKKSAGAADRALWDPVVTYARGGEQQGPVR